VAPTRRWGLIGAPIVALLAAAHVLYYFPRVVDDMFIFFRYAENLAAGDGLVYNLGERVEGFSSVTWVMLVTLGEWLGVNLVTWSKLLGIASIAGLVTGQYYFARERLGIAAEAGPRSARHLLPYLAPAFTACCAYVISWAVFGLETPLYLALLLWSAVTLGRYVFLTDDSGIGNPHEPPHIPCYQVQHLNKLLVRVIASELSGAYVAADPADVLRTVGSYDLGVCGAEPVPEQPALRRVAR
jgi:hypothetical protein